jgi:RHS repeat-associated protein
LVRSSFVLAEGEVLAPSWPARIDDLVDEAITWTLTLSGDSVYFTPLAPLAPAALYRARVVGAMSYLGDRQTTPFRWTFETYDPTPPAVTETTPPADAIDVERDTVVQVIFGRALLVGGEGASLTLEGPAGPVGGTLRWVPADERTGPLVEARGMNTAGRSQAFVGLEVRPFKPLQADTVYTATVKRVQSASGVPMIGEYTWQFRTENSQTVENVMAVGTSYYYFGSQRVALRISGDPDPERNGLFYIHTDHLGSTSLLSYGQGHEDVGEEVPGSRAAHLPFGEYRVEPAAGLSDRGFTGHRALGGLGLVHMKARFYLPGVGRFLSADTLIPDPLSPQSLNRFAYVLNNPLKFVDPTGHVMESDGGGGLPPEEPPEQPPAGSDPAVYREWLVAQIRWYLYHPPDRDSCPNCVTLVALNEGLEEVDTWLAAHPQQGTLKDVAGQFLAENLEAVVPVGMVIGAGAADELAAFADEFFTNPSKFINSNTRPSDIQGHIDDLLATGHWEMDTLGRGSQQGEGMMLREITPSGNYTGRVIQWHPGGGHHGPQPYWKISSPQGGTIRIGPQFQ